ncbi:LysR family transcriptional regulator [Motilimonas eburnea]|uniref:LysR family transcriptional regulator n=1 Tax=Motilimonas eburnea TaxID=1737488 RepID=UPI001E31F746|nr:LysR family transcriptional regulator [Motilimonas eburnea]MCE2573438.1 LysR family transcriptional regulator [Motilimonas eburnea]
MKWDLIGFDWNRTRAFLITAEEGTLSAAAKALGVSQPTLSRQVAALEQELGVLLFRRSGHKLALTDNGLALLSVVREMADAASRLAMVAQGQAETLIGNVVISASELDAIYRLPNIIAKLRQAEPHISIEVVVTNQVSDLKRREADIAIRNFKPTQPNLIARKLGEESIHLYATPEYLAGLPDVSAMASLQIIGFSDSALMLEQFNQQGWPLSPANIMLTTDNQCLQMQLCYAHLGLIYLTQEVGDSDPRLQRAFAAQLPSLQLPIWLVCHEELRANPRIKRVFDFIATELSC